MEWNGNAREKVINVLLEENVLNGRLEIWSRYMQIDGKGIDYENDD